MVPCKSTAEEFSFEWSHLRISSTDSKVRTTLHVSIIDSGSEMVYCSQGSYFMEYFATIIYDTISTVRQYSTMAKKLDYGQSLFPSAKWLRENWCRERDSLPSFRLAISRSPMFLSFSFDGLTWERGTARSLLRNPKLCTI